MPNALHRAAFDTALIASAVAMKHRLRCAAVTALQVIDRLRELAKGFRTVKNAKEVVAGKGIAGLRLFECKINKVSAGRARGAAVVMQSAQIVIASMPTGLLCQPSRAQLYCMR